ncbi:MAG: hypothetical protein GOMPHAMPRED_005546 [Gomphillus americanus]|uniref:Uncharacterized protein n=1 Tax=Gomphillus americanus TaxID=1940652 RepID=A0A8H3FRZ3_9LECA|nr:MAG: hypothetical protein GOMPHAMPRED_005546 [Gomphillus americanus]
MQHFPTLFYLLVALVEISSGSIAFRTTGFEYALIRRGSSGDGKPGGKPQQGRLPSSPSSPRSPAQARSQERISSKPLVSGGSSHPPSRLQPNSLGSPSIDTRVRGSSSSSPPIPFSSRPQMPRIPSPKKEEKSPRASSLQMPQTLTIKKEESQRLPLDEIKNAGMPLPKSPTQAPKSSEFPKKSKTRGTPSQGGTGTALGSSVPATQQATAAGDAHGQRSRDPRFLRLSGTTGEPSQQGRHGATGRLGGALQNASQRRERQYISPMDSHYRGLLSQLRPPQSTSSQQRPMAQSIPPAHGQPLANGLNSLQNGPIALPPNTLPSSQTSAFSPIPQGEPRQSPAESSGDQGSALNGSPGAAPRRGSSDSPESERGNQKRQRKGGE